MVVYCSFCSCFSQLSSSIINKSTDNIPNSLPSFLWLIRDSLLQLPADVKDPTEYLKKYVLCRSENISPTSEDGVILQLFPSVECRTLPRPSADQKIITSMNEYDNLLEPVFKEELSVLVDYIRKCLKVKSFADNGMMLKKSVEIFVHAVNSNRVLDLEATYFTAAESALFHISKQLIAEYKKEMENSLEGKYPVEELSDDKSLETLQSIHINVASSKIKKFKQKLDHFFPPTSDEEDCAGMDERIKGLLVSIEYKFSERDSIIDGARALYNIFKENNYMASKRQCQEVALEPFRAFQSKQSLFVTNSDFEAALSAVETAYYAQAVGPAKGDVYREKLGDLDSRKKNFAAQPTNLQAVGMGKDMIKLQWVETSYPGAIKHYEVELTHGTNTLTPSVQTETFSNQNSAIITKLTSNTEYTFRVRGISMNDSQSKFSESCTSSTTCSGLARGAAVLGWFALGFIASPAAGLATVPIGGPLSMLGGALAAPVVAAVVAKRAYTKHGPKGDLEDSLLTSDDGILPQDNENQLSPTEDDENQLSPPEGDENQLSPPEENENQLSPPEGDENQLSPPEENENLSPPDENENLSPPEENENLSPLEENLSPPEENENLSPPENADSMQLASYIYC